MIRNQRDNFDAAAARTDDISANHGIWLVVAALDEYIGLKQLDQAQGRVFLEDDDTVDAAERRNHPRARLLGDDRSIGALAEAARRRIAVDAHDERGAEVACALEHFDVAGVDEVEDAVREDDRCRCVRAPCDRLGQRPDPRLRGARETQSASSARGLKWIFSNP